MTRVKEMEKNTNNTTNTYGINVNLSGVCNKETDYWDFGFHATTTDGIDVDARCGGKGLDVALMSLMEEIQKSLTVEKKNRYREDMEKLQLEIQEREQALKALEKKVAIVDKYF